MKFYRIYIELTNICGLRCSFCPTKELPSDCMDLDFFETVVRQCRSYTNEIACHVFGDPLTLSNLSSYLDIIHRYDMKALLTTSGYFVKNHSYETLFHPAVKQINISLNSFDKNDKSISFEHYMEPIFDLCDKKMAHNRDIFINLRIWNLDDGMSDQEYNNRLFKTLASNFNREIHRENLDLHEKMSIRVDYKVLLHFDRYFEWPSLHNEIYGDGTCQGLQSHMGILVSGKVVPCCLDSQGIIALGDLHDTSLEEILQSSRAEDMRDGFKESRCTEELCLKCSYKERFNSLESPPM